MDLFSAFVSGLVDVFHPLTFGFVILGTLIGTIIGIMPAIGGMAGLALALPFVYGVDPFVAFPFLIALWSVSVTGGIVTTVLLNIPGDVLNAATLLDGYPMARKGEAGRALGAGLTASATGGLIGVFLSLLLVPVMLPLILAMQKPEMFFLVLLAIAFISTLGGGGQVKGLISGGLGVLLAFVGYQAATGTARFMFNSAFLFNGFEVVPVVIGLFAGAELVELAVARETISLAGLPAIPLRQMLEGVKDVFRHRWLWLRSCIVGWFFGVLPGIGGLGATYIVYGQAKQTSKHPERFGTGTVEGVIAPESSNTACHPGDLITTLGFSIPGSATMALILAAAMVVGIKPGPGLLVGYPELCFSMFWTQAISVVLAAGLCFALTPYLIRVTTIPPDYIVAAVFTLIFVSVFVAREALPDILVALVFTGVGVLMRIFGYSRPAFILGFVLGLLWEEYFWLAFRLQGPLFFMRPISLALIALLVVVFGLGPIKSGLGHLLKRRAT